MESVLTIHAPVAALLDYAPVASSAASALGAGGSGGVRLQLLDTPGPNEAGEEELRYQVRVCGPLPCLALSCTACLDRLHRQC